MRSVLTCLVVLILAGGAARAQDAKPDYSKLYNDTLAQLKTAQDRKAELGMENEKLAAHVAELDKQLQAQNAQLNDLKQQVAAFMDKTFFLRSHYAAWTQFITTHASIRIQWDAFLQTFTPVSTPPPVFFMDPDWPLSVKQ